MNYGETLAYWYFRFNGFFPLKNFVLHSSRQEERPIQPGGYIQGADCDLLAVRFPHVYEEVGGRPWNEEDVEGREGDWDIRFRDWGFSLETEIIGLIVEVKTGDLSSDRKLAEALKSFQAERMQSALQRMGMFEKKQVEDYWVKHLRRHAVFPLRGEETSYRIGKLFISAEQISEARFAQLEQEDVDHQVLNITVRELDTFIKERIRKYKDRKYRDRMMFPDDLLQYLFWKEKG